MNLGQIVGIAAVWAVSLVGVGLWAQGSGPGPQVTFQTTGSIAGTVTDSQGGFIPGATLLVISESRGTRSGPFVSATDGGFLFPSLAPDVYTIEVTMPGFRVLRRPGITVKGGDHVTVPTLVLEVPRSQMRTVRPGDTMGPVISGADIGFQPMFSPNTPAGAVAGRWMVRVDGEWRVATGVMQTVPAR
jgi:hypothetical protein